MDGKLKFPKGIGSRSPNSLYISFFYIKRRRETLPWKPTPQNIKLAARKREAILHDISIGKFDYAYHFPESKNSHLGKTSESRKISSLLDDISIIKNKNQLSTKKDRRSIINYHLRPKFGDMLISELKLSDVKKWIASLDISTKRINNVLSPLRAVTELAYEDGLIEEDFMKRIKNLEVRQDEPDPLTLDEIDKVLAVCTGQIRNLFQFAIWTGLRTSEFIALEWGDIDWNNGFIKVRRAKVRGVIKETKTQSGEREVKLLPDALNALNSQKQFTLLKDKEIFNNPRYEQPWKNDQAIRKTAWYPALKKAKVRKRTAYQTRHTYASQLVTAGEPIMWVSKQLGHKNVLMTIKRYARYMDDENSSNGDKIIAVLSQHRHKDVLSA